MIEKIAKELSLRKNIVFFTGAGMSTESGVPDFRSPGGVWSRVDLSKVATAASVVDNTSEFQEFYRQRIRELQGVYPNIGHKILAKWEKYGFLSGIITQNIDRLHHAAGSQKVVELHGNLQEIYCIKCREVYDIAVFFQRDFCEKCQGILRPNVILFGEALPQEAFHEAERLARNADMFFVLGSSLQVSPANLLPVIAKTNKAKLYIINKSDTPLDFQADGVLHTEIGKTLEMIDAALTQILAR